MGKSAVVAVQKEFLFLAVRFFVVGILAIVVTALLFSIDPDKRAFLSGIYSHMQAPFVQRMEITLAPERGAQPIAPVFENIRQEVSPFPFEILDDDPPHFAIDVNGALRGWEIVEKIDSIWEEAGWRVAGSKAKYAPPGWDEKGSMILDFLALSIVVTPGMLGLAGLWMWRGRPPWRTLFALPSLRDLAVGAAVVIGLLVFAQLYYHTFVYFFGEPKYLPPWELLLEHLGPAGLLALVAAAGVGEEIFFRGFALTFLKKRVGVRAAVLITSFLFALVHFQPVFFPFFFGIALVLAFAVLRSGKLMLPIFMHATYNFAVGTLMIWMAPS